MVFLIPFQAEKIPECLYLSNSSHPILSFLSSPSFTPLAQPLPPFTHILTMSSPSSSSTHSRKSIDLPMPNHAGLDASHNNWASIKAETLVRGQELIELEASTNLHDACRRLMEAGVSSVPVFDPETKTYVGMFDYADFLTYFLIVLHRTKLLDIEEATGLNDDEELAKAVGQAAAQQNMPVRRVSDISHQNPFYSCIPNTTLSQVVDILSKGIHRLVIMDDGVKARAILSQLTVVKYFTEHVSFVYPLMCAIKGKEPVT